MPRLLRVLVVDDNEDIVATMIELLRLAGHNCQACHSGVEALTCVREYDPDVVLMDIRMPGMNGWEAAKAIRRDRPGKRPMLIGISGEYTKDADKILAETSGFDCYLIKPADPKVLMKLLEDAKQQG